MAKISAKLDGVKLVNDEATIRLGVSSAPGFTTKGEVLRVATRRVRVSIVDLDQAVKHLNAGDVVVLSIRIERKA